MWVFYELFGGEITTPLHLNDLRGRDGSNFWSVNCFLSSLQMARLFAAVLLLCSTQTPQEHKVGQYFSHCGCNKSKLSYYSFYSDILI